VAWWDVAGPTLTLERYTIRDAGQVVLGEQVEVLVLAENVAGDGGRRLEISRSRKHDEQDRRLGMDTHCLVDERQATAYGAIADWTIQGRTLRILLSPEAAETFGIEGGYELALDPDRVKVDVVQKALESIVGSPLGGVWRRF
jgi:hypothetical protein